MIPEEEILSMVQEMGYLTVKPRVVYPSYYKLNDGTVLKANVNVNAVIQDARNSTQFALNSSNEVIAYVPKLKRRPEAFTQFDPAEMASGITDDDVEFEVLREEFSVYELSNGVTLSVKTVVGQVRKTKFFTPQGEPVYNVNINPIIKFKPK